MKPASQTIICKERGDCQSAALASLLEIPTSEVPPFVAIAFDEGKLHRWLEYQTEWLRARGLALITIPWRYLSDWRPLVGVYCIASVPSQKFQGGSHAVVGTWVRVDENHHAFRIAHDPRPDNDPYPEDVVPSYVGFLVPFNAAHVVRGAA
jgi:hypothetical protein